MCIIVSRTAFLQGSIMISLVSTDSKQLCNLYKMLITYHLIYLSQNLHDLKIYYFYCLKKINAIINNLLKDNSQRNISSDFYSLVTFCTFHN